jgi:RND family efflux transporter MFP subunit
MEASAALFELASVSLACRDQDTLLKTVAARVGSVVGARAVLIWTAVPESGLSCRARWAETGERIHPERNTVSEGVLAEVWESGETRRLGAKQISADLLSHLDDASRSRVKSAVYAALPGGQQWQGVLEVLGKRSGEFTADDELFIEEASRLAGQALTNLESIEGERTSHLATLDRLTALYDIGRTFTSTLELAELLPVVAEKIRSLLGGAACNIWLLDSGSSELHLAQRVGEDPTAEEGARVPSSEGLLAGIAQQASPKMVADPSSEPGLEERREAAGEDFQIRCWMAAPLRKGDEVLGVVELVNKVDGGAFDEDELFLLGQVSEQAAIALHNANLLESERKVHALDALLKISQEITSTLDLDHVLMTVVQQAASVVPFDRCIIGFFDRGRFMLGAVSGETEVPKTREMDDFRDRLEWVADQTEVIAADQGGEGWQVSPDEARAQIVSILEKHGYNGFYALPLRDDQGALGVLALVSGEANFLNENHKETLAILANQTSVAIRNAQLYQQVPLANLLQPFAARKQKLLAIVPKGRRRMYLERAGLLVAFLVLVPWPVRVGTNATVVPAQRRTVAAMDGGVVKHVFVHEGEAVQPGELLAQLDDSDAAVKLAQAQAALGQAQHDLAEADFKNDASAAGQATLRVNLHAVEVQLEQSRVAGAQLRAPIAGMVVTPKVEERTGTMVKPGEAFCEIVEADRMAAEMSVPESDLGLLRIGRGVALKLNAFPTDTFTGTLERIGAQTRADSGDQYFLVHAVFNNDGGRARDGMVGRARIRASGGWGGSEWYPVGYALLRDPFRWLWQEIWIWLP